MWIKKYTALMEKYLDKTTPQVSRDRADELFLKVKGNLEYLYALMDDQKRAFQNLNATLQGYEIRTYDQLFDQTKALLENLVIRYSPFKKSYEWKNRHKEGNLSAQCGGDIKQRLCCDFWRISWFDKAILSSSRI